MGRWISSWILLLLAQTTLVKAGRTDLHRRLGVAGAALGALLVVIGFVAQIYQTHRVVNSGYAEIPLPVENMLTIIASLVILGVGAMLWLAVRLRHRPAFHRRLMLLATIWMIGAATGRIGNGLADTMAVPALAWTGNAIQAALIVALAVHDLRTERRLHPATLWGGAVIVAFMLMSSTPMFGLYTSDAATSLARWIGRLPL